MLPAYTSLLTGQLPFDHGVRDEAGFALKTDTRTLAELLRSRGFSHRRRRVVVPAPQEPPGCRAASPSTAASSAPTRDDRPVVGAAGQRHASRPRRSGCARRADSDSCCSSKCRPTAPMPWPPVWSTLLKERGLYDKATVIVVGGRGAGAASGRLDDATLRVPLIVKQPDGEGAGRRVSRAGAAHRPAADGARSGARADPGRLRGRSLRPVLDDSDETVPIRPIYSESLAGALPLRRPPGLRAHRATARGCCATESTRSMTAAHDRSAEPDAGRARTPPRSAPSSIGCSTGTTLGAAAALSTARRRALRAARRPDGARAICPHGRTGRAAAGSDRACSTRHRARGAARGRAPVRRRRPPACASWHAAIRRCRRCRCSSARLLERAGRLDEAVGRVHRGRSRLARKRAGDAGALARAGARRAARSGAAEGRRRGGAERGRHAGRPRGRARGRGADRHRPPRRGGGGEIGAGALRSRRLARAAAVRARPRAARRRPLRGSARGAARSGARRRRGRRRAARACTSRSATRWCTSSSPPTPKRSSRKRFGCSRSTRAPT